MEDQAMVEKFVDGEVNISCPNCQNDFRVVVRGGEFHYTQCHDCSYLPKREEIKGDVEKALLENDNDWDVIVVWPGDDEVICDLCNQDITETEGGSFLGDYSLCSNCTMRVSKKSSPDELKEMKIFEKNFRAEVVKNVMRCYLFR